MSLTDHFEAVLGPLVRRMQLRRRDRIVTATLAMAATALLVLGELFGRQAWPLACGFASVCGFGMLLGLLLTTKKPTRRDVASALERSFPELDERLRTAVERDRDAASLTAPDRYLLRQTLSHAETHNWGERLPRRRRLRAGLVTASVLLTIAIGRLIAPVQESELQAAPEQITIDPDFWNDVVIEPGDVTHRSGKPLTVLARFPQEAPTAGVIEIEAESGTRSLPLTPSLGDPILHATLDHVTESLRYRLRIGAHASAWNNVTVFEPPTVHAIDAVLHWPGHARRSEETFEDVRHLSVMAGCEVTLTVRVTGTIATAILRGDDGTTHPLDPETLSIRLRPKTGQDYRIELEDHDGHASDREQVITIDVQPNARPHVITTFPARDREVSPLEELDLEAEIADDLHIVRAGLLWSRSGEPMREVILFDATHDIDGVTATQTRPLATTIALEEIGIQPDEMIGYAFFADDYDERGAIRRTKGDLFFAEVKPFEEVFRQSRSPSGSSSGSKSGQGKTKKLEELAKRQKQIVTATWNLLQSDDTEATDREHDVNTLRDAQFGLLTDVAAVTKGMTEPKSKRIVADLNAAMTAATKMLRNDDDALADAVLQTGRAYRLMLSLRAKEHNIVQAQSGGGAGSSGGRSSQQMNSLKLKNKSNRYRSASTAQRQTPAADTETLQTLNRLRELAKRQKLLNDRIRELDTQQRLAKTEQERREIERELKSLRDQQRRQLHELDELRQQNDQRKKTQQSIETARQLKQTREQMRQTSQHLEQSRLSKALASGSKTERNLSTMRDRLRQRTAGQLANAVRQLVDEAKELSTTQQQMTERLASAESKRSPSLKRDTGVSAAEIERQRDRANAVQERIKKLVADAEANEPALARALYEAARSKQTREITENLNRMKSATEEHRQTDAHANSRRAEAGLQTLSEGLGKAGELALGNELDALKRARSQLDQLSKSLGNERGTSSASKSSSPSGQQPTGTGSGSKPASDASSKSSGGQQPGGSQAGSQGRSGPQSLRKPSPGRAGSSQGTGAAGGPITGEGFQQWSNAMREVEELLTDPELRAEATRLRERVRGLRAEFKRHSKVPHQSLLDTEVIRPMEMLTTRVDEAVRLRSQKKARVRIDRDPVPERYSELVRNYFESLDDAETRTADAEGPNRH